MSNSGNKAPQIECSDERTIVETFLQHIEEKNDMWSGYMKHGMKITDFEDQLAEIGFKFSTVQNRKWNSPKDATLVTYQYRGGTHPVALDMPFRPVDMIGKNCIFGRDRHRTALKQAQRLSELGSMSSEKKRSLRFGTTKCGCQAMLYYKRLEVFPEYRIEDYELYSPQKLKMVKQLNIANLKAAIRAGTELVTEIIEFIVLTKGSAHARHNMMELSSRYSRGRVVLKPQVDSRVIQYIHKLVAEGVTTIQEARIRVKQFVYSELFPDKSNAPHEKVRAFNPSNKDFHNHIRLAREKLMRVKQQESQSSPSQICSERTPTLRVFQKNGKVYLRQEEEDVVSTESQHVIVNQDIEASDCAVAHVDSDSSQYEHEAEISAENSLVNVEEMEDGTMIFTVDPQTFSNDFQVVQSEDGETQLILTTPEEDQSMDVAWVDAAEDETLLEPAMVEVDHSIEESEVTCSEFQDATSLMDVVGNEPSESFISVDKPSLGKVCAKRPAVVADRMNQTIGHVKTKIAELEALVEECSDFKRLQGVGKLLEKAISMASNVQRKEVVVRLLEEHIGS